VLAPGKFVRKGIKWMHALAREYARAYLLERNGISCCSSSRLAQGPVCWAFRKVAPCVMRCVLIRWCGFHEGMVAYETVTA
jgi:hypothetical protein